MMDGRNCNGRTISLLNDSSDRATNFSKTQLPTLQAHSQVSSCTSTPSLSPQTPELVRSSSSASRTFASPSPLTPSFNSFESATDAHSQETDSYVADKLRNKMDDQNVSMYPPIPDATGVMPSAYPMPPQIPQQMAPQPNPQIYRPSDSPTSEPSRVSTVSATSNPKSQPKKNQYPCPMAKQVGCTDFFTTSGHAARHAKKHTGKKDAFCPECNKAFTRKDNMEQHRRTHQNGRGSSRSQNGDDSKVKKPTKQPAKKTMIKAEPQQFEAAVEQQLAEEQQPVQAPLLQTASLQAPSLQAQVVQAQQAQAIQQQALDQAMMMPPAAGPYFLNAVDSGPIPPLPQAMPEMNMRPTLQRSNFTNSLDYVAPAAPMTGDPEALHYSYPSPNLSNGPQQPCARG